MISMEEPSMLVLLVKEEIINSLETLEVISKEVIDPK
jgi:hypothetical protein